MRSQTIMSKQDKETLAIVNDPKVELIIILSHSSKSLKQRFLEINFRVMKYETEPLCVACNHMTLKFQVRFC